MENERLWRRVSWSRGDGGWRDSEDKTSATVEAFIPQWRREAVSVIRTHPQPFGSPTTRPFSPRVIRGRDRERGVLGWAFCTCSWRETQPDLDKETSTAAVLAFDSFQ